MAVSRERHTVGKEVRELKTSGGTDTQQQLKIHKQRNRKVWSIKGKNWETVPQEDMTDLLDTALKMLKELKEDVDKVRKNSEQTRNINRE